MPRVRSFRRCSGIGDAATDKPSAQQVEARHDEMQQPDRARGREPSRYATPARAPIPRARSGNTSASAGRARPQRPAEVRRRRQRRSPRRPCSPRPGSSPARNNSWSSARAARCAPFHGDHPGRHGDEMRERDKASACWSAFRAVSGTSATTIGVSRTEDKRHRESRREQPGARKHGADQHHHAGQRPDRRRP